MVHRLWWLARVLGVFPMTELRDPGRRPGGRGPEGPTPAARTASASTTSPPGKANLPGVVTMTSPRSWTADFSADARCPAATQRVQLQRSSFWLYYSLVVISAVLTYTIHSTLDDFVQGGDATGVRWTSRTDQYATLCEYLTLCSATLVAAACAWLCRASVIRHHDLMAEVDELLGLPPPPPNRRLFFWLAAMLAVLVTDTTVWVVTGENTTSDAIEDVPLYLTYYTCFTSEVLFMSDARAVQARLASVNQILSSACPSPGYRAKHGVPLVLPRTLSVRQLAHAHSLLCEATEAVSTRYGMPVLVDMLAVLINLVITSYFFLEDVLPFSPPPSSYTLTAMEMVFACMHFGRVVMLVEPAAAAGRESERTAVLVGYLCAIAPYGSAMYEQLKAMSVQLRHQRGGFSSCGFFDMNRSVIVSIVGSVATYLLVLLQLKPSKIPKHDRQTKSSGGGATKKKTA